MTARLPRYRLGVDVGGTFTDFVLLDTVSGAIHIDKHLTTPADPSLGILRGIEGLQDPCPGHIAETQRIAHATTLVANAVIERKGARTALLTTRGFRDVLELRRHVRVTTYELWADPPEPLVPRYLRLPVSERIYSDGAVLEAVARADVEDAVAVMRAEGVTSVAIVFLHAYVNPVNERAAAALLAELAPELAVTLSSDVLPRIKEFERASTATVNAYVKPLTRGYLDSLDRRLAAAGYRAPLQIMLSNGGLGSTHTAGEFPIRLIESGPVAGAIVGRQLAELMAVQDMLSFDMGGTTAKACLIRDQALPITDELEVARSKRFTRSSGFPVGVPAVNMIEVGAGGGSIAALNSVGLVQVGPHSAGAEPGPICYGRGGTQPTVTDADLVLGYLDPVGFAGGSMRLDAGAAAAGILREVGEPQGRSLLQAAWTIHEVVNETMAAAVRMHLTERGGNPEQATMVAFGGAGPVHATHLARKLRIDTVLLPLRAGVLSAEGLLIAPPAYDIVRTYKVALASFDAAAIEALSTEMAAEIGALLDAVEAGGARAFSRSLDVGYVGQSYQVAVPFDPGMDGAAVWERFAALYRERYGYFYDDVPAEVVNLRVKGEMLGTGFSPAPLAPGEGPATPSGQRDAYSAVTGEMRPFALYQREALQPGMGFAGPALVEEATSTTVIDADATVTVDGFGTLIITLAPLA